jgi:hypothetical protein
VKSRVDSKANAMAES